MRKSRKKSKFSRNKRYTKNRNNKRYTKKYKNKKGGQVEPSLIVNRDVDPRYNPVLGDIIEGLTLNKDVSNETDKIIRNILDLINHNSNGMLDLQKNIAEIKSRPDFVGDILKADAKKLYIPVKGENWYSNIISLLFNVVDKTALVLSPIQSRRLIINAKNSSSRIIHLKSITEKERTEDRREKIEHSHFLRKKEPEFKVTFTADLYIYKCHPWYYNILVSDIIDLLTVCVDYIVFNNIINVEVLYKALFGESKLAMLKYRAMSAEDELDLNGKVEWLLGYFTDVKGFMTLNIIKDIRDKYNKGETYSKMKCPRPIEPTACPPCP